MSYQLLADVVLTLHLAIVSFVVGGLALVLVGNWRNWRWVNFLWFRVTHLGAIAYIVAESWLGATCPLTNLEMWLQAKTRATTYTGSFVGHWVQRLLYYDAPTWVFTLAYTLFSLLVAATWVRYPPRRGGGRAGHGQ